VRALLIVTLAAAAAAQPLEFTVLKEQVLQERLRLAHPKNAERFKRLKNLFEETGCTGADYHEQTVKGSKEPNVICSVPGSGASANHIIVGAHFDAVGGDGVIDNWSGAVLLPGLAKFLREKPRRHQFEFVGFAAEEKGLWGSQTYVKSIPKSDRAQIAAVITLDSIGLTPTKCWPNGSSPELMRYAAIIARTLKLDFQGINVDRIGTTDSESFRKAHIPVLSLHSVTQETWRLINNPSDVWSAVSWQDYYDSYKLISALLAYLDREPP
jgi:Zn-dependent M28 family amino/carboxypeptidase